MAIGYRGRAQKTAAGSSVSVAQADFDVAPQAGDLLVALAVSDGGGIPSLGSGFASFFNSLVVFHAYNLMWKAWNAGDTTYTFTDSLGEPSQVSVVIIALSGANTTSPADTIPASFATGNGTSQTLNSVSPGGSDSWLIGGALTEQTGAGYSSTGTMTSRGTVTVPAVHSLVLATEALAASGATGSRTFTSAASGDWGGSLVAIKAAAVPVLTSPWIFQPDQNSTPLSWFKRLTATSWFDLRLTDATQALQPSGVATAEAVGTPTLSQTGPQVLQLTGIGSGEAVGTPTLTAPVTLTPAGVGTGEAAGVPVLAASVTVTPAGIASAGAFGAVTLTAPVTVTPPGVASVEVHGATTLTAPVTLTPPGVATGEAVGTPTLTSPGGGQVLTFAAIAPAEAHGTTTVTTTVTITPTGVTTGEAHGTTTLTTATRVQPTGVTTAEAHGATTVTTTTLLQTAGVVGAEAVGVPTLTQAAYNPVTYRPSTGTTTYVTGTTPRPSSGTTAAPSSGTTPRPYTTTTPRP